MISDRLRRYSRLCLKVLLFLTVGLFVLAVVFAGVYRNECLLTAAWYGTAFSTRSLLLIGADVNYRGTSGSSPLIAAVAGGDISTTRLLLDHGANIDATNKCDDTALIMASLAGQGEIVKLLLSRGADPNAEMATGFTPLAFAAVWGHEEVVRMLLENGAAVNPRQGARNPLIMAAGASWMPVDTRLKGMDQLLEKGAEVNAEDSAGRTALARACSSGAAAPVKYLLEHGAEIHPRLNTDRNALVAAALGKGVDALTALLEHYAPGSLSVEDVGFALMKAKHNRREDATKAILEKCGNLRLRECQGSPTLSELFTKDFQELVGFLLDRCGGDARYLIGVALITAVEAGDLAEVSQMIDKHADVNSRLANGWSPLMSAVKSGEKDEAMVRLLLDNGADINAKTEDGTTVLSRAALSGHPAVVKVLLDKGEDVELQEPARLQALVMAKKRLEIHSRFRRCIRASASDLVRVLFAAPDDFSRVLTPARSLLEKTFLPRKRADDSSDSDDNKGQQVREAEQIVQFLETRDTRQGSQM